MKKILITVLIALSTTTAFSQVAYYDALKVRSLLSSGKLPSSGANARQILTILSGYLGEGAWTDIEVVTRYSTNPFLLELGIQGVGQSGQPLDQADKLLNQLAGLDVTNYADALAQFMVERAKEELNVAFFQKFKKYVDNNPEIATLFPETSDFISNMMAHEYNQLINGLRDAFHQDLKNLLDNMDDVFLLPKYQPVVNDFPEILVVIRSIQIVSDLEEKKHPADIIRDFRDMTEWKKVERPSVKNLQNFIKTTSLVADAVRYQGGAMDLLEVPSLGKVSQKATALVATANGKEKILKEWSGDRQWITSRHFEVMFKDELALKIFLGLVYQQSLTDTVEFNIKGDTVKLADMMNATQASMFLFRSYFLEFLRLAEQTEDKLADLQNRSDISADEYFDYINAGIDIVEYGFKVANLVDQNFDGTEYVTIMRTGNNLYRNIVQESYSAAVTDALAIIESVAGIVGDDRKFEWTRSASKAETIAMVTKYPWVAGSRERQAKDSVDRAYERSYDEFADLWKVARGALKYGVFMANMVDAKSTDEIKQAIENAALPVGGSSYKKYHAFSIGLNSYLGAHMRLKKRSDPKRTWDQKLGVIAPIGLSFNVGAGRGGSFSLFAPLLDVGAIAEFRLEDDGSELTEKIKLGNIFSPGAYFVYGLPFNMPLALGIGAQYGPGLFEVNSTDQGTANTYVNPDWRFNVFLTVDMPLLNIFNGRKVSDR